MNPRIVDHSYILATIAFTVYSQLIMRWQVGRAGGLPDELGDKVAFVARLLLNPWVMSGIAGTFLAGVSWMLAMTKFEISYAYPYIGLTFVLILMGSGIFFHEQLTAAKMIGTLLIVAGIVVVARG
jgi:multidrug transporter EmrE-like cation transporter